ncbi:MAG: DNA-directed RNA polymerase subunit beta [Deltaproteobacteria bacterium]|nr:DNA-directed RNA polymerase subunit beta [Deltaproteobacteria bacterium]
MSSITNARLRIRKAFGSVHSVVGIPDLIKVQKRSYETFLQKDVPPDQRQPVGLQAIFKSIFPIGDINKVAVLDFQEYKLEEPKNDTEECRKRGMTYQAPVRVKVQLQIWDVDEETGERTIRDLKEQEVYFGEIPLMTDTGTFIINGTERVVVSQLHRSPGAFFEHDKGKTHTSGKLLYSARIIPYRGSWIDFEFDHKDLLYVRIDRRRKLHATVLLKALGYSTQDILDQFYDRESIRLDESSRFVKRLNLDLLRDKWATFDVRDPDNTKLLVKKGSRFHDKAIRRLQKAKVTEIVLEDEQLLGKVFAHDVIDEETGEVLFECNDDIDSSALSTLRSRGVSEFEILFFDDRNVGAFLRNTLSVDKIEDPDDAVMEVYRRLRPGDPSTPSQARNYFNNLFFNPTRYDLSPVGRLKMNYKFDMDEPLDLTVLTKRDILEVVRYLIELRNGRGDVDDIDHLGNRRVRSVGELLENQYRVGLVRMERAIRERMSMSQEIDTLMPHDLINSKPVSAVVKEYFGSSQLSQFMDQTNPLSELTHKRRLSALGPGGLTRDRAGFDVRDVHSTHYGRICPIETPEGPNIGLISSLSTYARVNEYGFIETPYRTVSNGRVTDEVRFYSALEEERHTICQATAPVDGHGRLVDGVLHARHRGDVSMMPRDKIDLMDVASNQIVSVAASLVPFLEHDDANRALMGSNMQRQAVPLLRARSPLVGTGVENVVARDSGVTVASRRVGLVESVDANRIVIRPTGAGSDTEAKPDIYNLIKYQRSNQDTCINQRPIVRRGDLVMANEVIADGPSTDNGELALGQNVLVAFMPWGGYNFEDAILVSERLLHGDAFTSVHIEEFECAARDTKLGKEEITRDIPNVSEEALADLDESGMIRIGAEVAPGDILVGKITPKGETQLSPEEKLLRAIFGEKAGDVRDTSLRVPTGVHGTVIAAKVFSRKGVDKDERTKDLETLEEERILKDQDDEIRIMTDTAFHKVRELLAGHRTAAEVVSDEGKTFLAKGKKLTDKELDKIPRDLWRHIALDDAADVEDKVFRILENLDDQTHACRILFGEKLKRLKRGDELPPGVIKMVKVYVAIKRRLAVGDKLSGRHGNKGVISRILPVEDMPFLADGTPVDLVLNPLGVPSRMNVGQILEVHLGWAAYNLGREIQAALDERYSPAKLRGMAREIFAKTGSGVTVDELDDEAIRRLLLDHSRGVRLSSPVFDGADEDEIKALLQRAGVSVRGQEVLFDGRTGDPFAQDVTVGVMYILKLHHLVDDKVHARSTGPYSLVTQQPLGGKAQFGGQRLGEMEVWAMEAYGAAYTLQEFLTVKSDDTVGRTRMYEAIVKGENVLESGLPESFKVLMKEVRSLGLDWELLEAGKQETPSI